MQYPRRGHEGFKKKEPDSIVIGQYRVDRSVLLPENHILRHDKTLGFCEVTR